MSIDRAGHPHSVSSLLDSVDKTTLGIPDFQRDFVWSPSQVSELLRTVARDWPCGSFLLQERPQDGFACRALTGAPALKRAPPLVVLDGQQRLTALYHALRERGGDTYYIDILAALESGTFEDEHLRFMKAPKYRRQFPDLAAEARSGIARVATLAKDDDFFDWVGLLPSHHQPDAIRFRSDHLPGFKHYSIPCIVLPGHTPLIAVAKIFETINRTGIQLDAFDLMVAKLHPHSFDLRGENLSALSEFPEVARFELGGIELLRQVALREYLRSPPIRGKSGPFGVRGVRRSDVINLSADAVRMDWAAAVIGTANALEFLSKECGVTAPELLPSNSMVLPVGLVLSDPVGRTGLAALRAWFWHSCFGQTHSQGANTQVIADARQLLGAVKTGRWSPEAGTTYSDDTLDEPRKRNEILLRGICCALVKDGAVEPRTGAPLGNYEEALETVPLFAQARFTDPSEEDTRVIPNYIVVSAKTKLLMVGKSPSSLVRANILTKPGLESQAIPISAVLQDDWQRFRTLRHKALCSVRDQVLGNTWRRS